MKLMSRAFRESQKSAALQNFIDDEVEMEEQ